MNDSDLSSGCILPFLQAAITGLFSALIVGTLAIFEGETRWALAGLLAGALAALVSWFMSLYWWQRTKNQDQIPMYYPGGFEYDEPEQEKPDPVRVEVIEGNSTHLIDLPATVDQLISLAGGLLSGQSLSESAWTGTGAPFSRGEFSRLRGELIRRGLAAWNNPSTPARGASLTRAGRAVMRHYASMADGFSGELQNSPTPSRRVS